jgi:hypothetical protein
MSQMKIVPKSTPNGSKEGQNLWNRVQAEFAITDCGGVELLFQSCCAADRAASLGSIIDRDGPMVASRSGAKEHPLLRAELGNRAFVVRTLTKLGISLEPTKMMGRPSDGFGWAGEDA